MFLFVCLFVCYCTPRSRIIGLDGEVTITSKWLHNSGLCAAPTISEQGGIFIVPHICRGVGARCFCDLTHPKLVAFYDNQEIVTI